MQLSKRNAAYNVSVHCGGQLILKSQQIIENASQCTVVIAILLEAVADLGFYVRACLGVSGTKRIEGAIIPCYSILNNKGL
jgi:hypothetical protein